MNKRHYIIPIFIPHRGCPYNCIFCNQKKITGQIEEMTVEKARMIIERYLTTIDSKHSIVEIAFFGGSFTGIPYEDQNKFLALANEYVAKGRVNYIRLSTRPDYINNDIIDNLKRFGVKIVELGIQSMDRDVLKVAKRGHSPEDVVKAIKLLRKEGFTVGAQLMVGLPHDNEYKALETVKKIVELKPHIARIYPVLVIKDTFLEVMYRKGLYRPLEIDEAVKISKKMLIYLERFGIKVIRIGLQPTKDLVVGENVMAGPYHPSIRQLVESEIYRDIIEYTLRSINKFNTKRISILSNPRDFSFVLGQKRSNYLYIKNLYNNCTVSFKEDSSIEPGSVMVANDEKTIIISKNTYYDKLFLEGIINHL